MKFKIGDYILPTHYSSVKYSLKKITRVSLNAFCYELENSEVAFDMLYAEKYFIKANHHNTKLGKILYK